jgi:hypothetical protein
VALHVWVIRTIHREFEPPGCLPWAVDVLGSVAASELALTVLAGRRPYPGPDDRGLFVMIAMRRVMAESLCRSGEMLF